MKLEEKIEHHLTPLIQAKYDRLIEETGTSKLEIPKEFFEMLRMLFQLGYQEGHNDMFEQVKKIYDDDPDYFVDMFEKEDIEL